MQGIQLISRVSALTLTRAFLVLVTSLWPPYAYLQTMWRFWMSTRRHSNHNARPKRKERTSHGYILASTTLCYWWHDRMAGVAWKVTSTYDAYELSGLWMSLPLDLQSMLPLQQRDQHRRWTPATLDLCRWYSPVAKSPEELESMLTYIHLASKPGLGMHLSKTKVMLNENATTSTVAVHWNTIDKIDRYVYLGKTVTKAGVSFIRSRGALHWDGQHSARWPTSWRAGRWRDNLIRHLGPACVAKNIQRSAPV